MILLNPPRSPADLQGMTTSPDLSLGDRVEALAPCAHGRSLLEACEACGVPAFDARTTPTAARLAS